MAASKHLVALVILGSSVGMGHAQNSGQTVRHHKIATQDPSQPPELTQAEASIDKKDYAAAEPLLKTVTTRDPSNYTAWFDLGFVYNALGRSDDSIAAYRKAVAAKPEVFESNLNLGLMLARAGQSDAEQFLRAATKLTPTANVNEGQARAWLSLAHLLAPAQPEEAIQAYRQAATLQPNDPEPHLAAGQLLEQQNHFADATEEYKQALAIDPSSSDALTGLANIYTRGQHFREAEEVLRKLVTLHPQDAAAHLQLGRMLAAAGKNDDAIAELQTAIKFTPGDRDAARDLADLYAASGKFDLAEAQYQALLTGNPKDPGLHQGLGDAYLKQKKFPEAQQEFWIAVHLKPDLGVAWGQLAIAADENKDYPLAIQALDTRAKYLPEMPVGYFLRATAYDHLRDYRKASENYHRFLEVANGQFPDQEWQAKHRLIAIEPKKK
jgi:tetratricopeptide (TPR) repeat protein